MFISTLLLLIYVIFKHYKISKTNAFRNTLFEEWEVLILAYLFDELSLNEVRSKLFLTVYNNKSTFIKYLFRYYETLDGEQMNRLHKLCLDLNLHLYGKEVLCVGDRIEKIKVIRFFRYFKFKLDRELVFRILDEHDELVTLTLLDALPQLKCSIFFYDIYQYLFDLNGLGTKRLLNTLEQYGDGIKDDLILLLRINSLSDEHRMIMIQLLSIMEDPGVDDYILELLNTTENLDVKLVCIKYATRTKSHLFLDVLKDSMFRYNQVYCYLVLKYFMEINYFNEKLLISSFFFTEERLIKKQVISIFKQRYCTDLICVNKGNMSDEFYGLMEEGFTRWKEIS